MISIIVAVSLNNVIGNAGKLPWHLPEDLQHFKKLTLGHTIIIGRKTFERFKRFLPGRRVIVLTHDSNYPAPAKNVVIANSVEQSLTLCNDEAEVFVAGGAQVYEQFINLASKIYLTRVNKTYIGDTLLPKMSPLEWVQKIESAQFLDTISKTQFSYSIYERINTDS